VMVEPPNKKQKIIHTSYDEDYFVLYSTIEIHREMLEDRSRTETYRSAITSVCKNIVNTCTYLFFQDKEFKFYKKQDCIRCRYGIRNT